MSDREALIRLENVSKKFCRSLKRSLWYGVKDLRDELLGRNGHRNLRPKEFWAVKNISFEIRRGEVLGIIGANGSGKTTTLKMISGLIKPDRGKIWVRGRIGALIALGAGFNPVLTGRENIYINGAVLGFSKKEIDKKFHAIVEFAELEEFIDTPVKHYSSGMSVRLGFAVAAHMEPDVMLIDEILSVGDVGFRAKCFNAIGNISKNAAVIFVSHSMPQIARICTDVIMMNRGEVKYQGKDVASGIDSYYSLFKSECGTVTGSGRARIDKIELRSGGKSNVEEMEYLDDLSIHLRISVDPQVANPVLNISFLTQELQIISQCNSVFQGVAIRNPGEAFDVFVRIPSLNFNPGVYFLSFAVLNENRGEVLIQHYASKTLRVRGKFLGRAPVQLQAQWDISTSYAGGSNDGWG